MEILNTDKLSINFGGLWAVKDLDMSVTAGEFLGLIGPNGSGKTTVLNMVSGIYMPTRGKMIFRGKDTTSFLPHEIRKEGIARTFQSSRLSWNLSVIDNVLSGLYSVQKTTWWQAVFNPSYSQRELRDGIEKAYDLLSYFSKDLINREYDLVKNIPHIDRRRVEICRALISEPFLLLLDEPSAGLNPEETREMMKDIIRIKERNPAISIIIIEHDMSVISEVCERVIVLNAGRKIAEGTYIEIAKNEEVRHAYLGTEGA